MRMCRALMSLGLSCLGNIAHMWILIENELLIELEFLVISPSFCYRCDLILHIQIIKQELQLCTNGLYGMLVLILKAP